MDIKHELERPFPENKVKWRESFGKGQNGKMLAYIDARDVMQRLDEVFGLMWQCRYSHVTDHGVVCEIGCFIDGQWLWRANGAGETNIEAEKGAMSDAFKRAAAAWGIGRYLYAIKGNDLPKWATPEGYDEIMKRRAA